MYIEANLGIELTEQSLATVVTVLVAHVVVPDLEH
jgi:hypothetical protein